MIFTSVFIVKVYVNNFETFRARESSKVEALETLKMYLDHNQVLEKYSFEKICSDLENFSTIEYYQCDWNELKNKTNEIYKPKMDRIRISIIEEKY